MARPEAGTPTNIKIGSLARYKEKWSYSTSRFLQGRWGSG